MDQKELPEGEEPGTTAQAQVVPQAKIQKKVPTIRPAVVMPRL